MFYFTCNHGLSGLSTYGLNGLSKATHRGLNILPTPQRDMAPFTLY